MVEVVDNACPPHLPPRDAWKVDPDRLARFYAPVDDRGFVLPDATVEMVKELFDDDYEWPIDPRIQTMQPDVHHFHWMRRLYLPENYHGKTAAREFRELPTVKGVLPRQFHNVIHEVTLPPQQPKYRDMEQHVRSYHLAKRLFQSAHATMLLQEQFGRGRFVADLADEVANAILVQKFDRQFRGYRHNIDTIVEQASLESLNLDIAYLERRRPRDVARLLGRIANGSVMNFVPRFKVAA